MERQYRHGIGRVDYELCAGVVDPTDASPLEAAKRELLEVLRPEQVRTLLLKNEIIQATHAAPLWKYFAENR